MVHITMQHKSLAAASRIRGTLLISFLILALLVTACGERLSGDIEVREESFSVGASPKLNVENENGTVTVRSSSGEAISVHATLRSPEVIEYHAEADGDTVRVTASVTEKFGRSRLFNFGGNSGIDLVIEVPSNTAVDIRSSNGKIEMSGVSGPSVARTSNGAIELRDVSGEFLASTSNGKITVADSRGVFDLKTSNGAIIFDGGLDLGGVNRMETSNGSIDVTLGAAPSVRLDARTSNGSIGSGLQFSSSTIEDDLLVGTLGDGAADLHIETSNGSINIQ